MKFIYVTLLLFITNVLSAQQVIDLCFFRQSEFTYTVTSSVDETMFYWDLGGQQLFGEKVVVDWSNYPTGTYFLTVYGIANGCRSETLRYRIIVTECSTIYIPSSFTPNDDRINDTWYPIGEGWESIEVLVFNRWGELIFESNDIHGFWDGSYKKGYPYVQNDVYIYKVTWKGVRNKAEVFYGKVTVVK